MSTGTKVCTKCKTAKPIEDFWKSRAQKDGRYTWCKSCGSAHGSSYYIGHQEVARARQREYNHTNSVSVSARKKARYQAMREDPVALDDFRAQRRGYMKRKFSGSVTERILSAARNRLYYALAGKRKAGKTIDLIGCTPEFLKAHLEKLFEPGWTWDDWGDKFEIDHITPCSVFNMNDPNQQRACFHYTNLQPLEKLANRQKWNKLVAA